MFAFILIYIMINFTGFIIMGLDKRRAKRNEYRISENTLWMVAIFGGALGCYFGMKYYRHKTKHLSFKIGFPVLAAAETALLLYFLRSFITVLI